MNFEKIISDFGPHSYYRGKEAPVSVARRYRLIYLLCVGTLVPDVVKGFHKWWDYRSPKMIEDNDVAFSSLRGKGISDLEVGEKDEAKDLYETHGEAVRLQLH